MNLSLRSGWRHSFEMLILCKNNNQHIYGQFILSDVSRRWYVFQWILFKLCKFYIDLKCICKKKHSIFLRKIVIQKKDIVIALVIVFCIKNDKVACLDSEINMSIMLNNSPMYEFCIHIIKSTETRFAICNTQDSFFISF